MSQLERMSFSVDKPLLKQLERLVAKSRYTNRSEYIRDLIREQLVQEQWDAEGEAIGTITTVFDHHTRGLGEKLTHLQHHFKGQIFATTHVHLDKHLCAEMTMVRGRGGDIKKLSDMMGREKGVLHCQLAISSTGKGLK